MAAVAINKETALRRQQQVRLGQLAEHIGATLKDGEPAALVSGMASLQYAQPGCVSFFDNHRHKQHLQHTNASAVIVRQDDLPLCPVPALLVDEPRQAYVKAMQYLYSDDMAVVAAVSGVAATASIDESVELAPDVTIGPGTVIEANAVVAAEVYIGPLCHIAAGVRIGAGSRLLSRVTLLPGTVIGERAVIHPGVVIGADGFGFVKYEDGIAKVPQVGGVRIGSDVEIGANSTIDCGTMEDTVIADLVKLDAQVHLGHNACIGKGTIISGGVRIGGSTVFGSGCLVGGGALVSDNISIADGVVIAGSSRIPQTITKPGSAVADWGVPLGKFRRSVRIFTCDLLTRIRALEDRLR